MFSSAKTKTPQEPLPILQILNLIQTGKWKKRITELRKLEGKEFLEYKTKLPAFTVSGVFDYGSDSGFLEHSGLFQLDIDGKGNPSLEYKTLWRLACKCPHTYAAFRSPSGRGVKLLMRCMADRDFHSGSVVAAMDWFEERGITVDRTVKALSQMCFVSWDPDLYLNRKAQIIAAAAVETRGPELVELEETRTNERILHECEEHWPKMFPDLWSGDYEGHYPDHSDADHTLICMLRDHCHSNERVAELFQESGLYREEKWKGRTRDYVFQQLKTSTPVKALSLFTEIEEEPGEEPKAPKKKKRRGWSWEVVDDVPEYAPEENDYLIKGILYANSVSAIYGPPGSAKTFVVLDMAAAIASGTLWNGRRVKKAGVLYIGLEGKRGVRKRIQALKKRGKLKDGDPFACLNTEKEQLNLMKEEHVDKMVEAIKAFQAEVGMTTGIAFVDTLARATAGGDENSARDLGLAVVHASMIQERTGWGVCPIHHSGKDITKGMRGSNALLGGLDTVMQVARHDLDRSIRVIRLEKQRDEDDNDAGIYTKLEIVELGTDRDGDPVTTCVLRFLEKEEIPVKAEKKSADDMFVEMIPEEGATLAEMMEITGSAEATVEKKKRAGVTHNIIRIKGDRMFSMKKPEELFDDLDPNATTQII